MYDYNKLSIQQKKYLIKTYSSSNFDYIFNKLKEEDKILLFLHKTKNTKKIKKILQNIFYLMDESEIIKKILLIKDDTHKLYIILQFKNDYNKIMCLKYISNEYFKLDIILTLKDYNKIFQINNLENINCIISILNSINNDNLKINVLDFVSENYKKYVISSLKNDLLKINLLNNKLIEKDIFYILYNIRNNSLKLENLNRLGNEIYINFIKNTIINENELINYNFIYNSLRIDNKITIGIEIEFVNEYVMDILELRNIKLFGNKIWNIVHELTVINGLEIVSPVLTDNNIDIANIYKICDIICSINSTVSDSCAGHIHIGSNYLTSIDAYKNLLEIFCNVEKILYIIGNDINYKVRNKLDLTQPISKKIMNSLNENEQNILNENDISKFILKLKKIQNKRIYSINFRNINFIGKNTIEFRFFNGTIDPNVWIENIKLASRMIYISEYLANNKLSHLHKIKDKLKTNLTEEEKLNSFLDLLEFTVEEKNIYLKRYMNNVNIQSDEFNNLEFAIVNFNKKL